MCMMYSVWVVTCTYRICLAALPRVSSSGSNETSELVLALERDDGVATSYMLLVDEDVGNGRLPGLLKKIGLDFATVGGFIKLLDVDLVLQVGEVGSEETLGSLAVGAVGLGEDDNFVARDGFFDDLLSRHGCSGGGGCDCGEERAKGAAIYAVEHG